MHFSAINFFEIHANHCLLFYFVDKDWENIGGMFDIIWGIFYYKLKQLIKVKIIMISNSRVANFEEVILKFSPDWVVV